MQLDFFWPKGWTTWLSEVPASHGCLVPLSFEPAWLGTAWLHNSQRGAAAVPCRPTFAHPGLLAYVRLSGYFRKCGWEEHMPLEWRYPCVPVLLSVLWHSHFYLSPYAFKFIKGTLIFYLKIHWEFILKHLTKMAQSRSQKVLRHFLNAHINRSM